MKNKFDFSTGSILLNALIFLSVLSLLTLTSLSESQLNIQMSHRLLQRGEEQALARMALQEIEPHKQNAACLFSQPLLKREYEQPWLLRQSVACSMMLEHIKFNYILEHLAKGECALIGKEAYRVDYYRLIIWDAQSLHTLLQATYRWPSEIICPKEKAKLLPLGRLALIM